MGSLFKKEFFASLFSCALVLSFGGIEDVFGDEQKIVPPQTPRPKSQPKQNAMPLPTPAPMPKEGELKCEVAMQRLLQASDYGTSLQGLKPNVKMQSFKVADVKKGMKIARESIAKLPNATPEQEKLIEQANALRVPMFEAEDRFIEARDQLEQLRGERANIESLVQNPGDFAVTLDVIGKQIAIATAIVKSADEAVIKKSKVYADFIEKNGLTYDKVVSIYTLVPKESLKKAMSDAVDGGEIADAAKRIEYLEKTIGRSGLPIPFDEIIVIRGQSMDERKKTGQQFRNAFPDSEEIERLLEYTARLNELLIGDSRSSASTKEIERLRDKAWRRLDELEKKNSLAVIAEVRAKLASERPVTVLKSNGVVIGAVSDGQIHGLSLDPVTYDSRGFWCRDAKSVSGGWHHSLGMMSLDMCSDKKAYPSFSSVEGHCRTAMNFQYYGPQGPWPMKTPTKAKGTAR